MSAFGAIEIDARAVRYDALAASSNKCLEGVPGLGFVVCRNEALAECKGNATTLVLDLFDQARKGKVKLYVRRVFIADDADLRNVTVYMHFYALTAIVTYATIGLFPQIT